MVHDVKQVISWVRAHADELGIDPARILVAGSSSGARLALTAALTGSAETRVAGAVGLYGYYGPVDLSEPGPGPPGARTSPQAPPLLVVHGDQDTLVSPANAREFVAQARQASSTVVYAELPGAQHSFDLVHSIRMESVVSAVDAFATWVLGSDSPPSGRSG